MRVEDVKEPSAEQSSGRYRQFAWKAWLSVAAAAVVGSGVTLGTVAFTMKPELNNMLAAAAASSSTTAVVRPLAATTSTNTSSTITQVFQQVEPSVVAVVNYQNSSNGFGQSSSLQEYGVGSGVLFKKDAQYAYLVTNNHVISGADKLEIVLYTGKHVTATLVGADPYTDLAVIRVPVAQMSNIQPAQFADSNQAQVGELAIAIGTPGGLDFEETVTSGIVSGKQRLMPVETPDESGNVLDYQSVLQTDAAINPGNSGGPLLDANGQVIGINSSKIVESGFEGMGFAIPSNEVKDIVQEILTTGHVTHPALGIAAYSLSAVPEAYWPNVPVTYGVYVYSVDSASAKAAGLKSGDVIVGLNGKTVQDEADLRTALFTVKPGDKVTVTVYRGSKKMTLTEVVGTLNTTSSTPSGGNSSGSTAGSVFGSGGGYGGGGYGSGSGSGGGGGGNGFGSGNGAGGFGFSNGTGTNGVGA